MLGKIEGKGETTEDEVFGWNHRLNRHESEQMPGATEEQESLVCYSPWGSQRVRHNLATEQPQQRVSSPTSVGPYLTFLKSISPSLKQNYE